MGLNDHWSGERAAFEIARELNAPVTTHAGVWSGRDNDNDNGIRLTHEHGFMTHAAG